MRDITIKVPGKPEYDLRPLQLALEDYVRLQVSFRQRVMDVATIVRNVSRKYRPEHLPAGFEALLTGNLHRAVFVPAVGREMISVQFQRGSNLEFPTELLGSSDRDVAVWARERIRASRHVAWQRARKIIRDDIDRLTGLIASNEKSTAKAQVSKEEAERRLAKLGASPSYVAPTRYPKKRRPTRA
ncbi:hypothetical protein [Microbacterium sp. 77mftsu3.1]|uniref:hypothetical protein n=1 Tax=Microbacterium sp. 77mftsu3.1 TaxID=1761802 RepID=UPI0003665778|nr:hypothetical protein [Microbacterium sp. 77mftsu3.1]SDH49394.1 hypothetical protein SAMN04488590_3437 [Microbacterium sp. 77mftsu3.1]